MLLRRLISLLIFIGLTPLFLIISLIIILDDGFPIIFKQRRIGKNNSIFFVYKFRTMKTGIPDIPTHLVSHPETLYTRTGSLMRKLSLDELPQLVNIMKGEMGFIGPRPALHNQDDLIELRTENGVHNLLPGVTGWAQVNGRDAMSIPKKVEYDNEYLHRQSFCFDLKILWLTIVKVSINDGISH
jgi:O-antigen biosynthesis protein WbqP